VYSVGLHIYGLRVFEDSVLRRIM
jgi:hypothetical protein